MKLEPFTPKLGDGSGKDFSVAMTDEERAFIEATPVVHEVTEAPREASRHEPMGTGSGVDSILASVGLKEKTDKTNRVKNAREIFNTAGASVKKAAQNLALMADNADTDGGRIKAAELILKVHGCFEEVEEKDGMVMNITVINNGDNNKSLVNLLCPGS